MANTFFADAVAFLTALNPWSELEAFINQGGAVLAAIMITTFGLWMLVLERFHYFWRVAGRDQARAKAVWQRRPETRSWYATQVRRQLLSILRTRAERNLSTIKSVVAVAPLLGLLGTVTGMIDVFDSMAFSGSGNTRAMAAGVSKATIPTMAGMVVSLTGMLCSLRLQRQMKAAMEGAQESFLQEESP